MSVLESVSISSIRRLMRLPSRAMVVANRSESSGQAVVVLSDTPYYESLENAMKIRKYVKQRNVAQLPKSVQDIIRDHQEEAGKFELTAAEELKKAIEKINAKLKRYKVKS